VSETGIAASVGKNAAENGFVAPPSRPIARGCAARCQGSTQRSTPSSMRKCNAMHRQLLLVLLATACLPSLAFAAPIYKCASPTGTVFSQVPCGKDSAAVGGSSAASAAAPIADPVGDKAALASIDARCKAGSQKIVDDYRTKFADANASIVDLHKRLIVNGTKDSEVQKEITTVEARKTDLLGEQDREIAALRNQCQTERSAEVQRQSDRDAAHAVVKR
jgi:hypothetical protein